MLLDQDIEALAKRAISRRLADAEEKREQLERTLGNLGGGNVDRVSQLLTMCGRRCDRFGTV